MNICLNEFIITSSECILSLCNLHKVLENTHVVYYRSSSAIRGIITYFEAIIKHGGILLWLLLTHGLWCFILNWTCHRNTSHLLGILWASFENLIRRPWTSMPMLKAIRRSRPLGLLFLDNMSQMARRAGSTAPDGCVAGCQVSSKSMECTWKKLPINNYWYMTLIIWYLTVTYFVLFSLFLWCNIIVMLLGTDSVNSIGVF